MQKQRRGEEFLKGALETLRHARADHCKEAPEKTASVAEGTELEAARQWKSKEAILPLFNCAHAVRPDPRSLTPQDALFLRACLRAKCYGQAEWLLDKGFVKAEPHRTAVNALSHLEYAYYGAVVKIGLGKLRQAKALLLQAVCAPAYALSAVALAAYKKLCLVGCILDGKSPALPRYVPLTVTRAATHSLREYTDLSSHIENLDAEAARESCSASWHTFSNDGNLGLVKEALRAIPRHKLVSLQSTHSAIPLKNLASRIGVSDASEAEALVADMVSSGSIAARISPDDGVVRFNYSARPAFDSDASVAELERAVSSAFATHEALRSSHEGLAADESFIRRTLHQSLPS